MPFYNESRYMFRRSSFYGSIMVYLLLGAGSLVTGYCGVLTYQLASTMQPVSMPIIGVAGIFCLLALVVLVIAVYGIYREIRNS